MLLQFDDEIGLMPLLKKKNKPQSKRKSSERSQTNSYNLPVI